jgi:hypothetical protein
LMSRRRAEESAAYFGVFIKLRASRTTADSLHLGNLPG